MRKTITLIAIVVAALFLVPASQAITDGELDGTGHPAVVLVLMEVNGAPAFRCSGTLLSPTIVLTAGHCAGEPGEFSGIRIFAESNVQTDPTYPFAGGPNTYEATAWACASAIHRELRSSYTTSGSSSSRTRSQVSVSTGRCPV